MKCPLCGGSEMVQGTTRKVPYVYKGQETFLEIHGDWCPDCDEMVLSDADSAAMEAQMSDFKRSVNGEAVDPEFIQAVRKKLGLNQKQAGELFGGGVNAFSRYELGKSHPPQSLVVLFHLLDRQPELMGTVLECVRPQVASEKKNTCMREKSH